jgi:hypothetical protein
MTDSHPNLAIVSNKQLKRADLPLALSNVQRISPLPRDYEFACLRRKW